ncbi:MAG: BrnA antitoxin family protein [Alphaproteobacteria bacterium]|nr:BrnA antitoxin family protein [Alphaproteobacteria bacterium]
MSISVTATFPALDHGFAETAVLGSPSLETQINVQLDSDGQDWFRPRGKDQKTRMNAVLKAYMESERRRSR